MPMQEARHVRTISQGAATSLLCGSEMASHHDAGTTLSKRDWDIHFRIEVFLYLEERAPLRSARS